MKQKTPQSSSCPLKSKPRKIGDQRALIASEELDIVSTEVNVISGPPDEKSKPRKIGDSEALITSLGALITSSDFLRQLKIVGMTQRDFSRFTRTPYSTVRSWAKGDSRIPGLAMTLLAILAGDQVLASRCRLCGWEPMQ